jgi:hypothetical protein
VRQLLLLREERRVGSLADGLDYNDLSGQYLFDHASPPAIDV